MNEVKQLLLELQIDFTFSQIKSCKKSIFEEIVRTKFERRTLEYLFKKIKSKWSSIVYGEPYLLPNQTLTFEDQIEWMG